MNSSKAVSQSPTPGTWASIKARLQSVERIGLVDLIHVLYESDPEIQQGLVMRFAPSEKCITPARKRIVDLVYPDPLGSLPIQADEAVEVIKKFHKISRDPISTCAMLLDGIEAGTAQAEDLGIEDDNYFNLRPKEKEIFYKCPRCGDNGVIREWEPAGWGRSSAG